MIFLETERLLFRTHEAKDEADFVGMHTDAAVRRYLGGQPWPLEKALDRFRNQYFGQPTDTYGLWAAIQGRRQVYRMLWAAGSGGERSPSRILFCPALLAARVRLGGLQGLY